VAIRSPSTRRGKPEANTRELTPHAAERGSDAVYYYLLP
jgi:hypothetical protein